MRKLIAALVVVAPVVVPAAAVAQDGLQVVDRSASGEEEVVVNDTTVPMEQDDALKLFVGTWRCTGTSSTEFGADAPTSFTVSGKKDLGGRWLIVKTELLPKAKGAKPIVSEEIWGYSREKSSLVRTGATSDGGWLTSTSTGWANDRFDWSGTSSAHAKPAKEKLAFTKKSDKELEVQVSVGAPELRVIFEGSCKR